MGLPGSISSGELITDHSPQVSRPWFYSKTMTNKDLLTAPPTKFCLGYYILPQKPISPAIMSYRRPSWTRDLKISRNSRTPCGYLIQSHPCQRQECDFSHDTRLVQKWQSQLGQSRTCKWGENCSHHQDGNCFYYHPPEHGRTRPVWVSCGLELIESLDVDSLVVDQDVCIEDEVDLASFNKVSDDEIIVPGE